MLKTKKILIALAVIGANVLQNMPVHTGLAAGVGWLGDGNNAILWRSDMTNPCATGANLVLDGTDAQGVSGIAPFVEALAFYAGFGESGNLTNNVITISDGQFTFNGQGYVAAAMLGLKNDSDDGDVTGNKIVVNGGTFNFTENDDICPEIVAGLVGNKGTHESAVGNNSVEVNGGTFKGTGSIIGGEKNIASGSNTGIVGGTSLENGNRVIVNNATFASDDKYEIIGGLAVVPSSSTAVTVQYNSVVVNNAVMESGAKVSVYGGNVKDYGGHSNIENNSVEIHGGTFSEVYGGSGDQVNATYNKITIYGGNFSVVYGGVAPHGDANNNIVEIYGGSFLQGIALGTGVNTKDNELHIFGGNFGYGLAIMGGVANDGTSSGNVLDLQTKISNKIAGVAYFQKMNFTLPAGINSDEIMLDVTNSAALAGVDVTTNLNGLVLEPNDYITLIKNVDDTNFTPPENHYILNMAGTKELVYANNGTPAPKSDYTIKQENGAKKWGSLISASAYTSSNIIGNVDGTTLDPNDSGLSATSYSGNEIVFRRGTYQDIEIHVAKNTEGGNVTGNTLTVNGGTFNLEGAKRITAGMLELGTSAAGDVTGNKIVIKGGEYDFKQLSGEFPEVVAGYVSSTADEVASIVSNNVIEINGGTFKTTDPTSKKSSFIGGKKKVDNGNASCYVGGTSLENGNRVIVNNANFASSADYMFVGGQTEGNSPAPVQYNSVVVNNATMGSNAELRAYGGYSENGVVDNNYVEIHSGTYGGTDVHGVAGGFSQNANVTNNRVCIYDGTIKIVGGGISAGADVKGNILEIYGGTITSAVGGIVGDGSAENNEVHIYGGTFSENFKLAGGMLMGAGTAGTSSGNLLDLRTKINNEAGGVGMFQKINFTLPADIQAGNTMLKTKRLMVEQNGGGGTATVNVDAAAGLELDEGTVITLVEATEDSISGSYGVANIFGEVATLGEPGVYSTSTAKVTIDDTSIKLTMLGFYSDTWYGTTAGGFTRKKAEAVAEGGILNVDGAAPSFAGTKFFYGGYSNGEGIEVKNNTVNVTGGEFGPGKDIYGGYSESGPANSNTVNIEGGTFNDGYKLYGGMGTASGGNTLNLKIKMGGKAAEVGCFQIMNFTLPSDMQNGEVMLKAETVTFDNTKISVDAANAVKLKTGDVITLIDADNVQGAWEAGEIVGAAGAIAQDSNKLTFTIGGGGHDDDEDKDKDKAPVEGIAAAVQTVNMSADLASGEGMKSLVAETVGGVTNTFGAITAGSSKYKTGSHVDVDGWGVIVGAGNTKEWKDGSATTYGLFFEYGKGDFDTYNGNVHGDGNSENKGVGIMARHKLSNNTYYEGNIRYGKQETEWSESSIGGYETDSRYYGISVGVGHIYPAGKNEIDVYGRYTYGHVGACDATVGTSEYHFDSVKSHRVRVGGKYNFGNKDSKAKPFVGLAWEREFKGESKASIAGVGEAPAPSMKGNTGILEVGCDWDVSKKWTLGLGANAYVGKRKGWDGMARVFYNF